MAPDGTRPPDPGLNGTKRKHRRGKRGGRKHRERALNTARRLAESPYLENPMPAVSVAQNRWAHAAAEGKIPGTSKAVGREFINDVKGLPAKADHSAVKALRGRLSKMKRS